MQGLKLARGLVRVEMGFPPRTLEEGSVASMVLAGGPGDAVGLHAWTWLVLHHQHASQCLRSASSL